MHKYIEILNFGYNLMTLGFVGLVIMTVFYMNELYNNAKEIRKSRSTKSVLLISPQYFLVHYVCLITYGIKHDLLAFIIVGIVLLISQIRIIDSMMFNAPEEVEVVIPVYLALLGAIVIGTLSSPYDYYVIMTMYFVGNTIIWRTLIAEFVRNSNVNLSSRLIVSGSAMFWFIYGISIQDWMLAVSSILPAFVVFVISLMILMGVRSTAPNNQS